MEEMGNEIFRLVSSYVFRRFKTDEECMSFFKDSIMSREDLVSEIIVYVYEKLHMYDKSRGRLSTFIYILCKIKCAGLLRKNKHNTLILSLDKTIDNDAKTTFCECVSTDENIIRDLIEKEVYEIALSKIDDVTRMYFFENYKQKDLADKVNMSQVSVSRAVKRNIDSIRRAIK